MGIEEKQQRCVQVAARGWDHPGWVTDFYPDDLPEDWRLTYYANEFSRVVVPSEVMRGADEAMLASWADDVGERFRFFIEIPEELAWSLGPEGLQHNLAVLGDKLGGVLMGRALLDHAEWRQLFGEADIPVLIRVSEIPDLVPIWREWRPGGEPPRKGVMLLDSSLLGGDIGKFKAWVEDVKQTCDAADLLIVLDGTPPDIRLLAEGQTMLELMGLA